MDNTAIEHIPTYIPLKTFLNANYLRILNNEIQNICVMNSIGSKLVTISSEWIILHAALKNSSEYSELVNYLKQNDTDVLPKAINEGTVELIYPEN